MQKTIVRDQEFLQVPWGLQLSALATTLRDRGRYVPPGHKVTLINVPEEERNDQGLPLFKAIIVPANGDRP